MRDQRFSLVGQLKRFIICASPRVPHVIAEAWALHFCFFFDFLFFFSARAGVSPTVHLSHFVISRWALLHEATQKVPQLAE